MDYGQIDPWAEDQTEERNRVTDVTDMSGHGWAVLRDVEQFLARFVVYPGEHERVAHTLWIGHTWFMDAWESTPRIAFLSPEPGSGKSRALEVTEPLAPRPVHAVNATPAYLFRKVADPDGAPTILFDEIDTIFGPKAKDNEELRGLLNAGHRKGAMAGRCVIKGKEILTEELPAYAAVALAGLDDLPDTIMTRSVVVRMRRRAPGERVEPWRLRTCGPDADALGERLREWSGRVEHLAGMKWPEMPEGVEDRDADVWEALLAVADLAGGVWPQRAAAAARAMVGRSRERTLTIGVMLLRDLRAVFTEAGESKLSTEDVLDRLVEIDESPWGDIRGKALDARGLSRRLSKYGVKSKTVRTPAGVVKGYDTGDLADAWSRYLPSVTDPSTEGSTDTPTPYIGEEKSPRLQADESVTSVTTVTAALNGRPATSTAPPTEPAGPADSDSSRCQVHGIPKAGPDGECLACRYGGAK